MMNALTRRILINLGLFMLVGGLAAMAWYEPGLDHSALPSSLLNLASAQIQQIAVERSGQENLAFERRGDHWWMTAPGQGAANPVLIQPILHLAEVRCPLRYAAAGVNLKPLGFDPPRLRLRLNDQAVEFGATAPTDSQRYLRIGETVYLCPDRLHPLLTSAAASFLAPPLESATSNARPG